MSRTTNPPPGNDDAGRSRGGSSGNHAPILWGLQHGDLRTAGPAREPTAAESPEPEHPASAVRSFSLAVCIITGRRTEPTAGRVRLASSPLSGAAPLDHAACIAAAREDRATYLRAMLAGLLTRLERSHGLVLVAAAMPVGASIVTVYAMLLQRAGVPAATPALLAVLLAAALSSIAGFAFAAICGAMLLPMISDPVQVVETIMVCSIANQSLSVAVLWRSIGWQRLPMFLIGGAAGLPLGVGLLLRLGHAGLKEAIGVLLTAYAAYALLKRPVTIKTRSNIADGFVGFWAV